MTNERFLIVRLLGLGDVVMASALVRRLNAEHPNAHVTWLCGNVAAPLVGQLRGVDDVIAVDERALLRGGVAARVAALVRLWRQLRRGGYSHVLLLHPDARYRALVAPLLSARHVRLRRAAAQATGQYWGDVYARLLDHDERGAQTGPGGDHFPLAELRQSAPAARPPKGVVLVPGGTRNTLRESALRRWPATAYADLAQRLTAAGHEVTIIGDEHDDWVRAHFSGVAVADLIGKLSLPETLACLADAALVVSHDTGPMHLARLTRTPLVALFGPTPPHRFIVRDDDTTVLWGGEHLACRPCYDGREFANCHDNRCMADIPVDTVFRTAVAILARRMPATPAPPTPQTPAESALR